MPASRQALYIAAEVASSASPPKDMVPKQSSETWTPVRPRGLCFMRFLFCERRDGNAARAGLPDRARHESRRLGIFHDAFQVGEAGVAAFGYGDALLHGH